MPTASKTKSNLLYKSNKLLVYKRTFSEKLVDYATQLSRNKPFVLLDSASKISEINRWSFLAACPGQILSYKNIQSDPFASLRNFFNNQMSEDWQKPDFSPYTGGPIGYISYDAARYIEKLPSRTADDLNLPDFYFIKPSVVLAHDIQKSELFIYLYRFSKEDNFADIQEIENSLHQKDPDRCHFPEKVANPLLDGDIPSQEGDTPASPFVKAGMSPSNDLCPTRDVLKSNISKKEFEAAVRKIREYIYAGDVYQVNLSQRFETSFEGDAMALYKSLRELNPGPFCSYLKAKDFCLISSSPERLICLNKKKAQTRPIAGTRRRGQNDAEDGLLSGNLLLDEKERAEHIMLVDLERNDLGKVCDYDSVHVNDLMVLEKYSHVIHIVSNVRGKLHPKRDCFDLIKAMFPGGTITGCPKVRCMEIIEELEPTRRGPYTGSLGYFSYNGSIDFNILIRTIVETNNKVYIQAGAGIVADSKPEREYYECISKAQALFKSLGHSFEEKQWEKMST